MGINRKFSSVSGELEQDLRREIYRKQLLPGEKLCSEMHFARKYHISRSTVRKALDSLAAEGLIRKVRGSGTFVSEKYNYSRHHSFSSHTRNRQILFLSFSSAFPEETLYMSSTFNPIFDGLGRVFDAYRYNLLFRHVNNSWEPPACLLNGDVAGIIFHGKVQLEFWNKYMAHLPCVGINHSNYQFACSRVGLDNFERSFLAVKHLYELGHRKIASVFFSMEPDSLAEERLWGFQRAMRSFDLDLPPEYTIILPSQRIDGERCIRRSPEELIPHLQIFTTPGAPTGLIISDTFELFAAAFKLMELEIPRDVSVVSGQNIIEKDEQHETYVYDRLEDICAESARLIVEMIENQSGGEYKKIMLSPQLVPGFSTAAVSDKQTETITGRGISDE
jgi:DNA-binding LacI/PurR family transcriptional regulator